MKKLFLTALFALFPLLTQANSLHLQKSFAVNELNKTNTFQGSQRVLFAHQEQKFALGFYTATIDNKPGEEHPFLVLTAWSPVGWVFVAKVPPIWANELAMYMGSEADDIRNYLWYIGQTFDPAMASYLFQVVATGDDETERVPLMMWQKILLRLGDVRVEQNQLKFH